MRDTPAAIRGADKKKGRPALVSVVIPAHNEAEGLETAVKRIRAVLESCPVTYEIIVVDDGSRDATFETLRLLAAGDPNIKGIRLSRNFGKEAALLAGIKAAGGDAVVTIDADLQHPPELIPEMLANWERGALVVHAVKRDRSSDNRLTRWRARVVNYLVSRLGGVDIRNASDFKLLDRAAVDVIVLSLEERRRFYRGLVEWIGFEQVHIYFDVAPRNIGQGKWSVISLIDLASTAVVSFTSTPLRIVTVFGLITLGFAALVATETLWSRFRGTAVSGFATLEITLLFIGSLTMISLGIVGEYIAKIYDEIKRRPAYLISTTCGFEKDRAPRF